MSVPGGVGPDVADENDGVTCRECGRVDVDLDICDLCDDDMCSYCIDNHDCED